MPPVCPEKGPPPHSQLNAVFSLCVQVETCELEYGPLNCDFVFRGSNEPFLDEATLPAVRASLRWGHLSHVLRR